MLLLLGIHSQATSKYGNTTHITSKKSKKLKFRKNNSSVKYLQVLIIYKISSAFRSQFKLLPLQLYCIEKRSQNCPINALHSGALQNMTKNDWS